MNRSSLVLAYALVGMAALALAVIDLALMLDSQSPWPDWILICIPIFASSFVVAGILAATRRPGSRMGALMVATGLVWLVAELGNSEIPALTAIGLILATVPLAMVFHLLLAFPSGQLRGRASVITVLVGYFVCTVMQAPQYLFGGGSEGPWTVLQVYDSASLADAGLWAQWGVGSCVTVATAVILWRRWRRIAPEGRRRVAPILAYGIFAVLYVSVSGRLYVGIGVPDSWAPWALFSQIVAVAIVPIAFGFTILSGGFGRTLAIDELAARLEPGEGESMATALAATLGDPSVELALWIPEREAYVDGLGNALAVPPLNPSRAAAEVRGAGGERLGAVIYDATLAPDSGLADAAARVIAMELDRERLAREVRASAVAARDDERRRLARDLHDGMQTRLLLLAMAANELSEEAKLAPDDRERAKRLERGLVTAADELRTLAHGFLPPALVERGIYAAAEDLAGAYPGVVEHRIPADAERPPVPVETAAYFVVSEAIANSLKHAGADSVRLSLARENGTLTIEVEDDGRGGAVADGSGIGGIRDRVEALHGTLAVTSPPLGGTLLQVALPCGVILAEDEPLMRESLVALLGAGGFEVVATATDGEDLVRKARGHRPDVAITDIRMPPTQTDEGLRAALAIRAELPEVGVLVLSRHVVRGHAADLLADDGAGVGYLLKQRVADRRSFWNDVERVGEGGTVVDPEIVAALLDRSDSPVLAELTARQREVLALIAEGRSNAAIADQLVISEKAVVKHASQIYDRLGLNASTEDHRRVLATNRFLAR